MKTITMRMLALLAVLVVPALASKIIQLDEITITRSGIISEIAVKNVIHGIEVSNRQALANPEALDYFSNFAEL